MNGHLAQEWPLWDNFRARLSALAYSPSATRRTWQATAGSRDRTCSASLLAPQYLEAVAVFRRVEISLFNCITGAPSHKWDCWWHLISSLFMLEDCTLMGSEAQAVDRPFLLVSVNVIESSGQSALSIPMMINLSWLQRSVSVLLLGISSFSISWKSEGFIPGSLGPVAGHPSRVHYTDVVSCLKQGYFGTLFLLKFGMNLDSICMAIQYVVCNFSEL